MKFPKVPWTNNLSKIRSTKNAGKFKSITNTLQTQYKMHFLDIKV